MKIKSLPYIVVLFLFATFHRANAQYAQDINGRPLTTKAGYTDVQGTPFLNDQWSKGIVKMTDGKVYKDMLLKYHEVDDVLYFQGKNEETLTFVDPVSEFTISNISDDKQSELHFRKGFKNIPNSTEESFFEVLNDGTIQLIKKPTKSVSESKEYNSLTVVKRFDENVKYYLIISGKAVLVKRDKKSILSAIGNKQPEMENYIKTNSLNMKNDDDMGKLVRFYNSL
jgi:hypothetical protein